MDQFTVIFIEDILIYSHCKKLHAKHLRIVLKTLRQHELYAKFYKCDFWLDNLAFLSHVISNFGIFVDTKKVEAVVD